MALRFFCCVFFILSSLYSQTLRVATVNVWSGLDYTLGWSVGEFETAEVREARFRLLVDELRRQSVDVVAIQEANPVCGYSAKLAAALGFDEIHQVVNAGLKVCGVGVPTNFAEGIAILAHPRLRLRHQELFKISGVFGIHGDALAVHFGEVTFALVGKIVVDSIPLYIANVHLQTALPDRMKDTVVAWRATGKISREDSAALVAQVEKRKTARWSDVRNFVEDFVARYGQQPVILLGDFNAEPIFSEVSLLTNDYGFVDAFKMASGESLTWVPSRNRNISYSLQPTYANGKPKVLYDLLETAYDAGDRRIDYIFLNRRFQQDDVVHATVLLDNPSDGLFASDHFGVLAEIDLSTVRTTTKPEFAHFTPVVTSSVEGFPILTYDTDVGFGYGVKGFFLNTLGWSESFDVTVFHSVRVERWYRLVFSLPDFELRQGKEYPLAFDVIVDYDKYLRANLFRQGNSSVAFPKETYTREPWEISLVVSRGFRPTLVGQAGVRFKRVHSAGFNDSGLVLSVPASTVGTTKTFSFFGNVRYDTRDSYINPHRGVVLQGEVEGAAAWIVSDVDLIRSTLQGQYFSPLFYPPTIFAGRIVVQQTFGDGLPLWALSTLGGNNTLRGFPFDRFVDRGMMLLNAEVRFPVVSRLKGVFFYDAGHVWNSLDEVSLPAFHANPGIGLRYVMDTFVVRLDVGFSRETTGLYFNFGHAF